MTCPNQTPRCADCGGTDLPPGTWMCAVCIANERDYDDIDFGRADDGNEPIGSCENCECNLYADDEWNGLCDQCAWHDE